MRYTTIIDIRENPRIYRNINARLLYLHLALTSGYHDEDRDICRLSLRGMAIQAGLTLSATRHALRILQEEGLVTHEGDQWRITKFVLDKKPTPRRQSSVWVIDREKLSKDQEQTARLKAIKIALDNCSDAELNQWLGELRKGSSVSHYGVIIPATEDWIKWVIRYKQRA